VLQSNLARSNAPKSLAGEFYKYSWNSEKSRLWIWRYLFPTAADRNTKLTNLVRTQDVNLQSYPQQIAFLIDKEVEVLTNSSFLKVNKVKK
jgi:hypothetical protein